jgi:hypothetical protein
MTEDPKPALLPCPFCGKHHTLKLTTFTELEDPDGDLGLEDSGFLCVVCDASAPKGPGGCGACGGFFDTESKAIAAWNARPVADAAIAQARRDALEEAADLCRRAKPQGGRMWTDEQAACFDCLSHVEDAIRALADKQEGM